MLVTLRDQMVFRKPNKAKCDKERFETLGKKVFLSFLSL